MTTGVLSYCGLHHPGTVLGTVAGVMVMGLSHRACTWSPWSSSSSCCLQDHHVISLILLLRIRLTRRGWICWSEPMGVPRPTYDGGGYASLSLEASQDWHTALELMPDEESMPEVANLGLVEEYLGLGGIIRPGPGNPGLARPELQVEGGSAGIGNPAQPGSAYAGLGRNPGQAGSSRSGPAGARWRQPTGALEEGPSRGGDMPAQPGAACGPAGEGDLGPEEGRHLGPTGEGSSWPSRGEMRRPARDEVKRPSRGRRKAGPPRSLGNSGPAGAAYCQPTRLADYLGLARDIPAQGNNNPAWALHIRAGIAICRPSLL
jgi:hypothetical protein